MWGLRKTMEMNFAGNYDGGPITSQPAVQGFAMARRNAGAAHNRRVLEAARLYADVVQGHVDPILLREAIMPTQTFVVRELMEKYPGIFPTNGNGRLLGLRETMSFSDYQALYVDVLDRMYYGFYSAYPIVNKALVKIHPLRDFRVVSRYLLDGVVTPLTAVEPAAPAAQRALLGPDPQDGHPATTTAAIQYQPKLYQAATAVNWRAFVNDDLGIFKDLANRLAIAGNRGISKFITTQYIDANGPHASLYTANYRNQINTTNGAKSNNPPMSSQGLMDALKVLALQRDSGGDPILITGRMFLWYGPAYTATAKNILNTTKVMLASEGGTLSSANFPQQWLEANNWLVQDMTPIMDPYIPIVASSANGNTTWGITVDPESQNRPAIEVGFLNGYEVPQIFSKVPNTQRLGGGVDAMLGDYYTMDQELKIITVMGGLQVDGRSTVASNGSGS